MISVGGATVLADGTGGVALSTATPQAPGTAAAGSTGQASDAGHVHPLQVLASAGTLAARPTASAAVLGRSYFATNVSPAGALYVCLTDGAGGYAWAPVYLGSDGDAAGTATVADGADGVKKTGSVVAGLLNATTAAGACTAVGAVPTSTLTTRGDLLRRGASAAERVALGAAGTRLRSDGTDPVWSEPDVVCTYAELATTYAPSAVLRGVIAYTSDTLATYVCRRTASSTYAWAYLASGADVAAVRTALSLGAISRYGNGTGGDTAWTGWSTSAGSIGGATSSIVSGKPTFTVPASNASTYLTSPGISRQLTANGRRFFVQFRIATLSGDATTAVYFIFYAAGASSTRPSIYYGCLQTGALDNGYINAAGAVSRNWGSSSTGLLPVDGTGWLAMSASDGRFTLYYGTGTSSTPPATWTVFAMRDLVEMTLVPQSATNGYATLDSLWVQVTCASTAGTKTVAIDHLTVANEASVT